MIQALAILLLVTVPLIASAEQVPVRSGEHGSFTRLVFDLPTRVSWDLEDLADKNAYRLEFDRQGLVFDTRNVFSRISTDRVESVVEETGASALTINLACRCKAKAFWADGRMLVVDIAPDNNPVDTATSLAATVDRPTDLAALQLDDLPRIGPVSRSEPLVPTFRQAAELLGPPQFDTPSEAAALMTGRLLRDVAEAASLGLLDPAADSLGLPDDGSEEGLQTALDVEQPTEPLAATLEELNKQADENGAVSIGGLKCTPDEDLDIASWSDETDVSKALATGRSALFHEFDRPSTEAITSLARTLLHFGLGAETRAVLAISTESAPERLIAMSYLVDGQRDPSGYFEKQLTCNGAAGLWSLLATEDDLDTSAVDQAAVARTFEGLPRHLRELVGPVLAERYTSNSNTEAAADILRRLERSLGGPNDETEFGKAKIAAQGGNTDAAKEAFEELAGKPGPQGPVSLVEAIAIAHDNDQQVDRDLLELSEAFVSELKETDQGPQLWQAHIRALLANGDVAGALDALSDPPGDDPSLVDATQTEVAENAIRTTSDAVFLQLALTERIPHPKQPASRLTHETAVRLLGLGMAEVALDRLNALSPADRSAQTALLTAEALLALNRPEEAEILLIGRQDDPAVRLRAKARAAMGDHAYARRLYASVEAVERQNKAARMAGQWQSLDEPADQPLAQAAAIPPSPALDASDFKLSEVETLFQDSVETRGILRALLDATEINSND
jgi:tetratricopeptide (TPR) repeat protein